MTDQQKIWAWCDHKESETHKPHGLIVYRATMFQTSWIAGIQRWERESLRVEGRWVRLNTCLDREGSSPEEAIAKLAEALGL